MNFLLDEIWKALYFQYVSYVLLDMEAREI